MAIAIPNCAPVSCVHAKPNVIVVPSQVSVGKI